MLLRKCALCSSYTLLEMHCNARTKMPGPPPFSPADKYGKYRRMAKERRDATSKP